MDAHGVAAPSAGGADFPQLSTQKAITEGTESQAAEPMDAHGVAAPSAGGADFPQLSTRKAITEPAANELPADDDDDEDDLNVPPVGGVSFDEHQAKRAAKKASNNPAPQPPVQESPIELTTESPTVTSESQGVQPMDIDENAESSDVAAHLRQSIRQPSGTEEDPLYISDEEDAEMEPEDQKKERLRAAMMETLSHLDLLNWEAFVQELRTVYGISLLLASNANYVAEHLEVGTMEALVEKAESLLIAQILEARERLNEVWKPSFDFWLQEEHDIGERWITTNFFKALPLKDLVSINAAIENSLIAQIPCQSGFCKHKHDERAMIVCCGRDERGLQCKKGGMHVRCFRYHGLRTPGEDDEWLCAFCEIDREAAEQEADAAVDPQEEAAAAPLQPPRLRRRRQPGRPRRRQPGRPRRRQPGRPRRRQPGRPRRRPGRPRRRQPGRPGGGDQDCPGGGRSARKAEERPQPPGRPRGGRSRQEGQEEAAAARKAEEEAAAARKAEEEAAAVRKAQEEAAQPPRSLLSRRVKGLPPAPVPGRWPRPSGVVTRQTAKKR